VPARCTTCLCRGAWGSLTASGEGVDNPSFLTVGGGPGRGNRWAEKERSPATILLGKAARRLPWGPQKGGSEVIDRMRVGGERLLWKVLMFLPPASGTKGRSDTICWLIGAGGGLRTIPSPKDRPFRGRGRWPMGGRGPFDDTSQARRAAHRGGKGSVAWAGGAAGGAGSGQGHLGTSTRGRGGVTPTRFGGAGGARYQLPQAVHAISARRYASSRGSSNPRGGELSPGFGGTDRTSSR